MKKVLLLLSLLTPASSFSRDADPGLLIGLGIIGAATGSIITYLLYRDKITLGEHKRLESQRALETLRRRQALEQTITRARLLPQTLFARYPEFFQGTVSDLYHSSARYSHAYAYKTQVEADFSQLLETITQLETFQANSEWSSLLADHLDIAQIMSDLYQAKDTLQPAVTRITEWVVPAAVYEKIKAAQNRLRLIPASPRDNVDHLQALNPQAEYPLLTFIQKTQETIDELLLLQSTLHKASPAEREWCYELERQISLIAHQTDERLYYLLAHPAVAKEEQRREMRNKEVSRLTQEVGRLEERIVALKKDIKKQQQTITALENEYERSQRQLREAHKTYQALEKKMYEKERESSQHSHKNTLYERDITGLKQALQSKEADLAQACAQIQQLEIQLRMSFQQAQPAFNPEWLAEQSIPSAPPLEKESK